MHLSRSQPPPWLFGVTSLPYGAYTGFVAVAMPYLLRNAGLTVDRIAGISAVALAPSVWYFLWAPLVDIGLRRRSWLMLAAGLSACCMLAALLLPLPSRIETFSALVVIGTAVNMLV